MRALNRNFRNAVGGAICPTCKARLEQHRVHGGSIYIHKGDNGCREANRIYVSNRRMLRRENHHEPA